MGGKVLAVSLIHILLISEYIIVNVVIAAEAKYDVSFRYTNIPQNFWFSIILKTILVSKVLMNVQCGHFIITICMMDLIIRKGNVTCTGYLYA
mgnify:CR=1 FL=1